MKIKLDQTNCRTIINSIDLNNIILPDLSLFDFGAVRNPDVKGLLIHIADLNHKRIEYIKRLRHTLEDRDFDVLNSQITELQGIKNIIIQQQADLKTIKPKIAKCATMIQLAYTYFPSGLTYMQIVELLYTLDTNFKWDAKKKKAMRGWWSTVLCGRKYFESNKILRTGILYKFFTKNPKTKKWVPKEKYYNEVYKINFHPFSQKYYEVVPF